MGNEWLLGHRESALEAARLSSQNREGIGPSNIINNYLWRDVKRPYQRAGGDDFVDANQLSVVDFMDIVRYYDGSKDIKATSEHYDVSKSEIKEAIKFANTKSCQYFGKFNEGTTIFIEGIGIFQRLKSKLSKEEIQPTIKEIADSYAENGYNLKKTSRKFRISKNVVEKIVSHYKAKDEKYQKPESSKLSKSIFNNFINQGLEKIVGIFDNHLDNAIDKANQEFEKLDEMMLKEGDMIVYGKSKNGRILSRQKIKMQGSEEPRKTDKQKIEEAYSKFNGNIGRISRHLGMDKKIVSEYLNVIGRNRLQPVFQ